MKIKHLFPLLIVPMALASCGKNALSVEQMQDYLANVSSETVYPYYRVIGAIDYNNMYIEVDNEFTNDFREGEFVPYSRYNPGSFDPEYDTYGEELTMIFANSSKSYWSRMPLRITKDNFYGLYNDGRNEIINPTCAYYQLHHYMKTWSDSFVKNADNGGEMVMEVNKDKDGNVEAFVFSGVNLHSKIIIDNYPMYPDTNDTVHFPYGVLSNEEMYRNEVDASFNFKFEYNKDGWLTREYIVSTNYNDKESSETQFYCEAKYSYSFHA
ncbi:MAG: hypothetical protein MJ222_00160 [Bacilli bacterium]|nr:hypothetical protein [Bacilli bacterium]